MADYEQRFLDAEQYMEACLTLGLQGKNAEALKAIDKAIECDPNFAEAFNKKGDVLFKLGRIQEALDCYLKSHELNPNIQNNYFDLGRSYLMLGDYTNAMQNFTTAYQMKKQYEIHAFIGKIYFEQGDLKNAEDSFKNVLAENDHQTMACYYMGMLELQNGNPDQAKGQFNKIIEKYSRIIRTKPDMAEAYYYLGKCYFFNGDYDKAIENLKLAIKYDTDEIDNHYSFDLFYSDAEAFAALAEAQAKAGHISEAKENILKAVSLEPNNKKLVDLKTKLGY